MINEINLIFVHGAGGSSLGFYYQTLYFNNSNAIDLPGHPEGKTCQSIEEYVEWLNLYIRKKNYRNVVLIGHSMGGAIAQLYGINYGKYLTGLILISTGARLKVDPSLLSYLKIADQNPTTWLNDYRDSLIGVNLSIRQKFIRKKLEIGPLVHLNDLLCCNNFDVMERVDQINCPTLIINGSKDDITPTKYARYLFDKIPNAKIKIITGAGHSILIEKPVELNQAIATFINNLEID
jgi:pimeloyl-ACP methyl ester carboxylesterase